MDSNLDLVDGVKLAAIDLTTFPGTPANKFWASTLHSDKGSYGSVDFYDGLKGGSDSEEKRLHVRLVRAGRDWNHEGPLKIAKPLIALDTREESAK